MSKAVKEEFKRGMVIEKWEKELLETGWKKIRSTLWQAPNGAMFRGPYAAWRMMKSVEQWGGEPLGFFKSKIIEGQEG